MAHPHGLQRRVLGTRRLPLPAAAEVLQSPPGLAQPRDGRVERSGRSPRHRRLRGHRGELAAIRHPLRVHPLPRAGGRVAGRRQRHRRSRCAGPQGRELPMERDDGRILPLAAQVQRQGDRPRHPPRRPRQQSARRPRLHRRQAGARAPARIARTLLRRGRDRKRPRRRNGGAAGGSESSARRADGFPLERRTAFGTFAARCRRRRLRRSPWRRRVAGRRHRHERRDTDTRRRHHRTAPRVVRCASVAERERPGNTGFGRFGGVRGRPRRRLRPFAGHRGSLDAGAWGLLCRHRALAFVPPIPALARPRHRRTAPGRPARHGESARLGLERQRTGDAAARRVPRERRTASDFRGGEPPRIVRRRAVAGVAGTRPLRQRDRDPAKRLAWPALAAPSRLASRPQRPRGTVAGLLPNRRESALRLARRQPRRAVRIAGGVAPNRWRSVGCRPRGSPAGACAGRRSFPHRRGALRARRQADARQRRTGRTARHRRWASRERGVPSGEHRRRFADRCGCP